MRALEMEWRQVRDRFDGMKLRSLYFGGGTPYLLGPENLKEIISWIQPGAIEITLEANPGEMELETLAKYREAGVNRLSVGIQSFDDALLKKLSRTHSALQAQKAVEDALSAGFENISIDLMYDIPTQTREQWEQTLATATALPITHISLYNLTIEPFTVYHKYKNRLSEEQPPEEESIAMLQSAVTAFEEAGFTRYEISAFCRDGKISTHNSGYWTDRPFYGLGPSAFSYFDGKRFRNVASLNKYAAQLEQRQLPIDFSEALDPAAKTREQLVLNLRLSKGIDTSTLPLDPETLAAINELITDGLLLKEGPNLKLTEKGKLFYDTVASSLI